VEGAFSGLGDGERTGNGGPAGKRNRGGGGTVDFDFHGVRDFFEGRYNRRVVQGSANLAAQNGNLF